MKNLPILICGLLLAFVISACGGGGASTTGGGSGNLAIAYDLKGFQGVLVNAVTASQTPQSVQVNVNGTVRTVGNAIVPLNQAAGASVIVLSEGSKLFNASIPNASSGATIGNLAYTVPISADGTLNANILAGGAGLTLKTPAATWQGYSLPNGIAIGFLGGSVNGDLRSTVNSSISYPYSPGYQTGTLPVVYTSPGGHEASMDFKASDNSEITFDVNGTIGNGTTMTAPWSASRASSAAPVFTTAQVIANF